MMIFYIFTISIIFQFGTIICTVLPNTVNSCHNRSNISKPYDLNCTHFIECDQTNEVIKACGPGTVFDEKNGICTWPYKVAQCSHVFSNNKSIKESSNKYDDKSENTLNSQSRSAPDQPQWNTNQNQQLNENNVQNESRNKLNIGQSFGSHNQNYPPVNYGKQSSEHGYEYPISNTDPIHSSVRKEYPIGRPPLLDKWPDESRNKPNIGQSNPGQSFGSHNQNYQPANYGKQSIENGYKYPVTNIDPIRSSVRKEYPIGRPPLLDEWSDESRNIPYNKQYNIIEEGDDEPDIDVRVSKRNS